MGIIIGTAILWGLTALIINPLVDSLVRSRMTSEGVYAESIAELSPEERGYWERVETRIYIMCDIIILGIAGFIAGFGFGYFLIGISLNVKGWPGMIAFIGCSYVGSVMRG